jgi:hypothetical protein
MTLGELHDLVLSGWPFGSQYVALPSRKGDARTFRAAAAAHACLHISKAAGRLAGQFEKLAHGGEPDADDVAAEAANVFISTLRAIEFASVTPGMVERSILWWGSTNGSPTPESVASESEGRLVEVETAEAAPPLQFDYVNWRGTPGRRRVRPTGIRYGTTEWEKEPGWLLDAYDLDKQAPRTFALVRMRLVGTP